MLKKIMLSIVAVVLLAGVVHLIAQERNDEPATRQTPRQRRGMGRRGEGMTPEVWIDQVEVWDPVKVGLCRAGPAHRP